MGKGGRESEREMGGRSACGGQKSALAPLEMGVADG